MTIDIETLISVDTAASILNKGLDLAQAIGLPVTSWRVDDPTRALYGFVAEYLATREGRAAEYIRAGFLSKASGDWLTVLASEVYGVDRVESTYSTPSLSFANGGGGRFELASGDVTFKSSVSGVTFHNTSGGVLAPGGTLTLDLVADVAGSAGTVAANEIDTIVSTVNGAALLGVTISSSGAAVGLDEQDDDSLKQACLDTRGALSPDGPPDAYEYVVKNSKLTGVTTITRSRSTLDDDMGHVSVYVAGPSGPVDGGSITAGQTAVEKWATPIGFTPTVQNATADATAVHAVLTGTDLPADFATIAAEALGRLFSGLQIADENGATLKRSRIMNEIHKALPGLDAGGVDLVLPASDVVYVKGHYPALGTTTIEEA